MNLSVSVSETQRCVELVHVRWVTLLNLSGEAPLCEYTPAAAPERRGSLAVGGLSSGLLWYCVNAQFGAVLRWFQGRCRVVLGRRRVI